MAPITRTMTARLDLKKSLKISTKAETKPVIVELVIQKSRESKIRHGKSIYKSFDRFTLRRSARIAEMERRKAENPPSKLVGCLKHLDFIYFNWKTTTRARSKKPIRSTATTVNQKNKKKLNSKLTERRYFDRPCRIRARNSNCAPGTPMLIKKEKKLFEKKNHKYVNQVTRIPSEPHFTRPSSSIRCIPTKSNYKKFTVVNRYGNFEDGGSDGKNFVKYVLIRRCPIAIPFWVIDRYNHPTSARF